MSYPLKRGSLLRYKRRIFCKDWREEYVVLFDDSTLVWYKDEGKEHPDGVIVLRRAPELLAYGQYTCMIPNRPELPEGFKMTHLLAFGTKGKKVVYWFLCKSQEDFLEWISAINKTLPEPPPPYSSPISDHKAQGKNGYVNLNNKTEEDNSGKSKEDTKQQEIDHHDVEFSMGLFVGSAISTGWGWGYGLGWNHEYLTNCTNNISYEANNVVLHHDSTAINIQNTLDLQDDGYDANGFDGGDFDSCADFIAF